MLLATYITKELQKVFLLITLIFLVILLSKKLVFAVSQVAVGILPLSIVTKILLLYIPEILLQILPLAWLLSIIFLLHRLYASSEYLAMLAGGFLKSRFMQLIIIQAVILAIVTLICSLFYLPKLIHIREEAFVKGEQEAAMNAIVPGIFRVLDSGKQVFYVEEVQGRNYKRIFVVQLPKEHHKQLVIITAQSGNIAKTQNSATQMILQNGQRYSGVPGKLDYNVMEFSGYNRTFLQPAPKVPSYERLESTKNLWRQYRKEDAGWSKRRAIVELQWRCSMPIAIIILTLIAFGIIKLEVRNTNLLQIVCGVMIYLVYANLLSIVKLHSKNYANDLQFGLLFVHLGFLLFGMVCVQRARRTI